MPFVLILALLGLVGAATFALEPLALAQVNPSWIPTGSLNIPRRGHTATLLPNGKVLVVGGWNGGRLNSAELYDPATGTWSLTGSLNMSRYLSYSDIAAQRKGIGRWGRTMQTGNSAELYDPAPGRGASPAASILRATCIQRHCFRTVRFWWREVQAADQSLQELYDPATGTWSVTGGLVTDRSGHTATLLQNGQVLVGGGMER